MASARSTFFRSRIWANRSSKDTQALSSSLSFR